MLTFGLDTALQSCGVAIVDGDRVLARMVTPMTKGHAEFLAPMVKRALDDAGTTIKALDRVGVVVGPGGFTGVRVGLAFARAMALGTDLSVVGVNTMDGLVHTFAATHRGDHGLIAPVVDARRGDLFAALYDDGLAPLTPAFCAVPTASFDQLSGLAGERPVTVIGGGAALLPAMPRHWRQSDEAPHIDPVIVARLAAAAASPTGPPAPIYLRAPDAAPGRPSIFDALVRS